MADTTTAPHTELKTTPQKEVSPMRVNPRRLEDGQGNTVGAVIDLAHQDHDHCLVVMHVLPDLGLDGPFWPEKLRIPPPGYKYSLWCEDCPSVVTLISNPPPCIEDAYVVTHSASCPWLAVRLAGSTR